jgi:hypothetical protein
MQSFPWEARVIPVELLINSAISLLINLETARQGRSMLLSDEQRLLFEGRKKGVCLEYQIGFYELLTNPRMKAN